MPKLIRFRVATAIAAAGFFAAGIARPALDYVRFHQVGQSLVLPLDLLASAAVLVGVGALLAAVLGLRGREARRDVQPPGFWRLVVVLTPVLSLAGALLGLGLYAVHGSLPAESGLWFEMALHAIPLAVAVFTVWLCVRGPRPVDAG